jgi:hypothetical protein
MFGPALLLPPKLTYSSLSLAAGRICRRASVTPQLPELSGDICWEIHSVLQHSPLPLQGCFSKQDQHTTISVFRDTTPHMRTKLIYIPDDRISRTKAVPLEVSRFIQLKIFLILMDITIPFLALTAVSSYKSK